jgi:hypothetical protein
MFQTCPRRPLSPPLSLPVFLMPVSAQQVRHVSLVQGSGGGGTPYALLGWCILVEQVVSLLMLGSKVVKLRQRAAREEEGVALEGEEGEANVNQVEQGGKCMLCLEMRRATTATSCGMQSPIFNAPPPKDSPPPHLEVLSASLSAAPTRHYPAVFPPRWHIPS